MLTFSRLVAGSVSTTQAAGLLGVDGARIRQRLAERTLYGFKLLGSEWQLPSFQFTEVGLVPNLGQVLRTLPADLHPVEVYNWLTLPEAELELEGEPVSPLDWLRTGGSPEPVLEIARQIAETV